jgi:probable non-F420 flavinoid oxidoreductase
MSHLGFHASHEQLPPSELLAAVQAAERAGFGSAMCSDHFAPWSSRQGHSGHSWSWLGAALASTKLELGVVTAPGERAHPAITAQAAATLAELFPGRFWLALGSGQALNEHITGSRWPDKDVRTERLAEAAEAIKALFAGETVSRDGLIRVDRAKLWSLPAAAPPVLAAAVTPATASRVVDWAEGLITVNQPDQGHAETLSAYREAGGRGPAYLQAHLSWAESRERALEVAHDQWREALLGSDVGWELALPEHFEEAARFVRPADVEAYVHVSEDLAAHERWLDEQADAGFDRVMVHHVGKEQREFIAAFAAEVLARR